MTDNLGLGVALFQVFQEEPEGGFLCLGTGVCHMAFLIQAANIADANGMLVVVLDMSTGIHLFTAFMDATILVDDPVEANNGEVAGLVPAVNVGNSDCLVDTGSRTMYDDVQHLLHGL